MKGHVVSIKQNSKGRKSVYGFIRGDDFVDYYFRPSDLKNRKITQIQVGYDVEFDPTDLDPYGHYDAKNIVVLTHSSNDSFDCAMPGLHESIKLDDLQDDEKEIVQRLGRSFFVTKISPIAIGDSLYHFCYLKPTDFFVKTFKMAREMVVVISNYLAFQPRCFEVAPKVFRQSENQIRIDRSFYVLISKDGNIDNIMNLFMTDGELKQTIIPFSFEELLTSKDVEMTIQDKFRKHLFDQDLFSVSSPIDSNVFFFGRRDYCADIVNKCKNGFVSGVFGLRRSGKTSVLFAVSDSLRNENRQVVYIPCEGSLKTVGWKKALCKVVLDIYRELGLSVAEIDENEYENGNAAAYFEEDLIIALKDSEFPITLMFDEIENITFGLNLEEDSDNLWWDGTSFVNFWGAIKSFYTKHPGKISIVIAGTNPMINEINNIKGRGLINPMFSQLAATNQGAYLPSFTLDDTRTMINTLGSYMGLKFDDYCVSKLTTECAGHPYLIRLMCSNIHRHLKKKNIQRPHLVTAATYDECAKEFDKSEAATSFFSMILEILNKNYKEEYQVLKELAIGNKTIIEKTQNDNTLPHLIGYGLIDSSNGNYTIRYKVIENFLAGKYKYERAGLTIDQQRLEITTRTNDIEILLRQVAKNTLICIYGNVRTREIAINAMKEFKNISKKNIESAEKMSIKDLFDSSVNKIYLAVLLKIISNNYELFSNAFGDSKERFDSESDVLNLSRRCPSHAYGKDAKGWSENDFIRFRESASYFEKCLENFK